MTSDIVGDERALRQKLATIPLGRVVEPEEVGAAVSICVTGRQIDNGAHASPRRRIHGYVATTTKGHTCSAIKKGPAK